MTDLRLKRRDRLIAVARAVFVAQGYRAATMEGIAAEASMSKATLYSYFPDKAAIFEAVAVAISEDLVGIVEHALAAQAEPAAAVIAALVEKHSYVYDQVRSSRFATDLFAANSAISKHHFDAADDRIAQALAQKLSEVSQDSVEMAELLLAASQGIANAAESKAQLETRVSQLRSLIDGASQSGE